MALPAYPWRGKPSPFPARLITVDNSPLWPATGLGTRTVLRINRSSLVGYRPAEPVRRPSPISHDRTCGPHRLAPINGSGVITTKWFAFEWSINPVQIEHQ